MNPSVRVERRPRDRGRRLLAPTSRGPSQDPEVVAHELRTPLTSVLLGSRILLQGTVRGTSRQEVVRDLAAETQRLADAVEDLLELVHLGGWTLRPEPVALQHLVRATLARAVAMAPTIRFRALLPADIGPVLADEALLGHLVQNLVAGACTVAAPGGRVDVTLAPRAGGRVRLRVAAIADLALRVPPAPSSSELRQAATTRLAERVAARLDVRTSPGRQVVLLRLATVEDGRAAGPPSDRSATPV